MTQISRLTDPKPCLPAFSLRAQSTMSDNTSLSDPIVCLPLCSDNDGSTLYWPVQYT